MKWEDATAAAIRAAVQSVQRSTGFRPNAIVMSFRVFAKLKRRTTTKRRFRRWRARERAFLRSLPREDD